jgi:predicted regulator of Ras-like GTPase activity (Roadblock/LC7/MglB family)
VGHWLAEQVAALNRLSEQYEYLNRAWQDSVSVPREQEAKARAEFMAGLRAVVEQISRRRGISGCFVANEGLLVEAVGDTLDFEALAAMAQWCETPAEHAAKTLTLGTVQQILIIGSENKLALIRLGRMTLGIVSPTSIQLAETLKT